MKTLLKQTLTASVLSAMLVGTTFAAPQEKPDVFIKRIADNLIANLQKNKQKLKSNPAEARSIVRTNLDPYIDAQAFTRIVMGTYANNQYSDAAQRAQFEKNLRENLIQNYASAFAKFTNQTYTMRPYKDTGSKNPVVSLDFMNDGEKIPVAFQLVDKGNQWKVRNINVSGIDLGLQFRNQFAANVKRNGGNIDKAIATFKPDADVVNKK
ncbi:MULTISPECIES: ABC transporter substrate-binding protein [unclassified Acinetobacter]|uniref:MlaC/ttg2D family ABC transporter substrate-binding protein n=1 Tax=unclassified Acinetobacter TaxID=196816 RepID=UPI00293417B5|nr:MULTISPECIES: ABC transporter substrate-binding protein [unclassified Acinetobacter]WOE31142.1 ABC transporter substrate-binding protein [Acinetobacter sp. SAAs470]WOE39338.1 ABC transporter substrate-binding protein [Acinetobacter sp. SAAs474]